MKPAFHQAAPQTIDAYIALQPPQVQPRLQALREALRALVPTAQEKISYGIPTFALGSNLFHFAAFKAHIGLYPGAAAIEAFAERLAGYKTSKGTIQVPLDRELPFDLVGELVAFNLKALAPQAIGQGATQRQPVDDATTGAATGLTPAATPPIPRSPPSSGSRRHR